LSDKIRDAVAQHRFELEQDGHLALVHYRLAPGLITFTHTEVPAEFAGRGVGSRLIAGALAEARRRGLKVVADCSFVRGYIKRHAEYSELLNE